MGKLAKLFDVQKPGEKEKIPEADYLIFSLSKYFTMDNFQFDAPQESDRGTQTGGIPAFRVLNYRSGKTSEMVAKRFDADSAKTYFEAGDVGFSYYDKEHGGPVPVKEGVFALLGLYWKLNTFTGADKNAIRYTSNMVLNIREDKMRVYANGDATQHEGTYKELKAKGIWGAETKIGMFWLMLELATEKLYAIELTNAVKNGFKVSVMKAYNKPISAQSIEKEGLFGLADSPDNFHVFTFAGVSVCDVDGLPYKGKNDAYFVPQFSCGIIRREKHPEVANKCQAARESFFSAIRARLSAPQAPQAEAAQAEPASPLSGVTLPAGWSFDEEPAPAVKDPFADGATDLPF
jgi:hypothetical protein